ncbi:hypothetical protein PJL18_01687 [Paenarthrobacter nicotinovorans]|nr:hypothetical protein [Paenarthrobacter nicotinovorans]
MQAMSAMATWAVMVRTLGPRSPKESTIGSTKAAEDDASNTMYTGAWPVPKTAAIPKPVTTASSAAAPALVAPPPTAALIALSRIGTCVPATNMISAKPTSAINVNAGSPGSTACRPVRPMTMPASSWPRTTGKCHFRGNASSGPKRAAAEIRAS